MRFPGVEFGFENSEATKPKLTAHVVVLQPRKSKRRASTDPDRVWQIIALCVIATVLIVAGWM